MLFIAPAHDAQLKTIKVCRRIDNCASWYWAQHGHRKEINHSAVVCLFLSCVRVESAFKMLKNKGMCGHYACAGYNGSQFHYTAHIYISRLSQSFYRQQ